MSDNGMTMQQHYVTFYSPGTLVPEQTTRRVDAWDVAAAVAMAGEDILRSNMRCNGWERILTNRNSYAFTTDMRADDVVLRIGTLIYFRSPVRSLQSGEPIAVTQGCQCSRQTWARGEAVGSMRSRAMVLDSNRPTAAR